jgi:hypothetical protein
LFDVNPLAEALLGCTLSLVALMAYEGWQAGTVPMLCGGV